MKLIDLPLPRNSESYSIATQEVTTFLATEPHVQAVYQVGTVRHPGISDIDLLVVVADDAASERDPLAGLAPERRYLFTHSCFVVPTSLAHDLPTYVLLDGFRHLAGAELPLDAPTLDRRTLEIQRARGSRQEPRRPLHPADLQGAESARLPPARQGDEGRHRAHRVGERAAFDASRSGNHGRRRWFGDPNEASRRIAGVATELLGPLRDAVTEATRRHELFAPFAGPIEFAPTSSSRPGRASSSSIAAF